MNLLHNFSSRLSLIQQTLYFLRKHLVVIFGLGLIAAFGRVIQLGGFGQISSRTNIFLEVIVALARILIFFYVLGLASFKNGALRVKQLFTQTSSWKYYRKAAIQKIKKQWVEILFNYFVFLAIAFLFNYLIDLLAYETCLYLTLKDNNILSQTSSEWTIILFFKNISVIPFTLTFEALFLLWIVNKFRTNTSVRVA